MKMEIIKLLELEKKINSHPCVSRVHSIDWSEWSQASDREVDYWADCLSNRVRQVPELDFNVYNKEKEGEELIAIEDRYYIYRKLG